MNSDLQWLRELLDERFASIRADAMRQQAQLDAIQAHLAGRRDEVDVELTAIKQAVEKRFEKLEGRVETIRDTILRWGAVIAVASPVLGVLVIEAARRWLFG